MNRYGRKEDTTETSSSVASEQVSRETNTELETYTNAKQPQRRAWGYARG